MTKEVYLTGTAKWVKIKKPDTKYGTRYTLDFYPDNKSWETIKEIRLNKEIKQDEDGRFIRLMRDHEKEIGGEKVIFGPPSVFGPDNKPFDDLIGNGSTVQVLLSVYNTKKAPGSRLEALKVINLVEFNANVQEAVERSRVKSWDGPAV